MFEGHLKIYWFEYLWTREAMEEYFREMVVSDKMEKVVLTWIFLKLVPIY